MKFKIGGVVVTSNLENFTEQDAKEYIDFVIENANCDAPLEFVDVKLCDDGKVDVNYQFHGLRFERIRRITGKGIAVCCQAV